MKTTDLRISNLVMADGVTAEVDSIGTDFVSVSIEGHPESELFDIGSINGIRITEERLLKAGFTRMSCPEVAYRLNDLVLDLGKPDDLLIPNEWYWKYYIAGGQVRRISILQFFHQIQNLFYSLCGEELTIKP